MVELLKKEKILADIEKTKKRFNVECYESPVNHVIGEKNQYWEVN